MVPLKMHLLCRHQRQKALSKRLEDGVGDGLELLDEVVVVIDVASSGSGPLTVMT